MPSSVRSTRTSEGGACSSRSKRDSVAGLTPAFFATTASVIPSWRLRLREAAPNDDARSGAHSGHAGTNVPASKPNALSNLKTVSATGFVTSRSNREIVSRRIPASFAKRAWLHPRSLRSASSRDPNSAGMSDVGNFKIAEPAM